MDEKKYVVRFSGYAVIKAGNEEQAKEKFEDDDYMMKETGIDEVETVADPCAYDALDLEV